MPPPNQRGRVACHYFVNRRQVELYTGHLPVVGVGSFSCSPISAIYQLKYIACGELELGFLILNVIGVTQYFRLYLPLPP